MSKHAYIYKNYNMIEGTATEILAIISKERNWHKALISPALASNYKKQLKAGKLLNSTAEKMLYKLGYRKIKKEQWSEQQPTGCKTKIMATFETVDVGTIALIQQTEEGRIVQIGLTPAQRNMLQFFLAKLSEESKLIQMPEEYDLVLKSSLKTKR